MSAIHQTSDRLVKLPEACALVAKGRTSFLEGVADGDLPQPVSIGKRAVAWRLSDLQAWIESRPFASDVKAAA